MSLAEREVMRLFQEAKAQMVLRHLREQHMVQEADGDGRPQLPVILSFVQLLLVQPGQ